MSHGTGPLPMAAREAVLLDHWPAARTTATVRTSGLARTGAANGGAGWVYSRLMSKRFGGSVLRVAIGAALVLSVPAGSSAQRVVHGARSDDHLRLVRELVIGENGGGPEYGFSGIWFAAAAADGGIFVSDGADGLVRKFDGRGRFRGFVGRIGSGPGEYRRMEGLAVVADTALVVLDRGNGRAVVFDTAGSYRGAFSVRGGGFHPHKVLIAMSDGTIGVRLRGAPGGGSSALGVSSVFVRYRLSGQILDSTPVPQEDLSGLVVGGGTAGPRGVFPARTVFAVLPQGGIATAHTNSYHIDVAPAGRSRFAIERSVASLPLAGREREEWQQVLNYLATRGVRVPELPRRKPPIRDLFADDDGRIWVEVYTEASSWVAPSIAGAPRTPRFTLWEHNAYDVFSDAGRFLGRIDLPLASRALASRGNAVWTCEENRDGVLVLVRHSVEWLHRS